MRHGESLFGLLIKPASVAHSAVEAVVDARVHGGAFRDLSDFCRRIDAQKINKRVLEALILSGSMDALAPNRASLMLQLPECVRAAGGGLRCAGDTPAVARAL